MESPHKEGSGSVKVLLIPPLLERNYEIFFKHFKPEFKKVFAFYMIKPIPRHENGTVNYKLLLDQCRKIIISENIGIVFANKQAAAFVAAVLCGEFKHIRGPSVEAVFICNHDYYKTLIIDGRQHKIPYCLHRFGDDKYDFAYDVLNLMRTPCHVRPCLGIGHSTYEFSNRDQLINLYDKCKQDTVHIVGMHKYLVESFIDLKKYPMATEHAVLMNTILEPFGVSSWSLCTKVQVEACVFQKEIIPWSVCDVVTFPSDQKEVNNVFSGVKMPSSLSDDLLAKLWCEFRKDLGVVIQHGFDFSFMHAQYNVHHDGHLIHLVSMCVGPNANNTKMYTQALDTGNNIEAALQVSMGIRPHTPKIQLDNQIILNHIMLVFEANKADNVIRFTSTKSKCDVWLRYLPGQDIVIEPAKRHAVVGIMTAKGKDVDQCFEKIKHLRSDILKIPDLVPLTCQSMPL